jgi:hypothetical protein
MLSAVGAEWSLAACIGTRRKTASEITISERDSLLAASQALREENRCGWRRAARCW